MNLKTTNFEDLHKSYYNGTGAARAATEIVRSIEGRETSKLAHLLRDHRKETVQSQTEIAFRDRVDELLTYCGILEIGSLAKFIDGPDGAPLWSTLGMILSNPAVRNYYVQYYPVRLPYLLHARIRGEHSLGESESSEVHSLMIDFLRLDHRFDSLFGEGYLLPMLDHFTYGDIGFDDVVQSIQQPGRFIDALLRPENERDITEIAIQELSALVQFSYDLKRLLDRAGAYPLLQSEMWHHFGYWYGSVGTRMRSGLGEALDQFLRWQPEGEQEEALAEIREEIARAKAVIYALTSSSYSTAANAIPV
jgi:hypothetical protein